MSLCKHMTLAGLMVDVWQGVKAQLKSMQQQLPVIAPVKGTVKSRRGAEFL